MDIEEFQVRGLYDPGMPGAPVRRELLGLLVEAHVADVVAARQGRVNIPRTDLSGTDVPRTDVPRTGR